MGKLLWKPSKERIEQANMTRFIEFVNRKYGLEIDSYFQLYEWSIGSISDFWATMWEFGGIISSRGYDKVIDDPSEFPRANGLWAQG
ncbi:MAG: acetoacetate--CoA ligase, partial [Candidatus Bathyarchaeota archaeon]|nr:acetoacetate--CoA ligase [Candidatus Bathyarchaeota archaeon]